MSDAQGNPHYSRDGETNQVWQQVFDELEVEVQWTELGQNEATGVLIPSSSRHFGREVPFVVGNPWSNRWDNSGLSHFRPAGSVAGDGANHLRQDVRMPLREPQPDVQRQARIHAESTAERLEGVERPLTAQPLRDAEVAAVPPQPVTNPEATFQALLINLRIFEEIIERTLELLGGLRETIQAEIDAKTEELRHEDDPGSE